MQRYLPGPFDVSHHLLSVRGGFTVSFTPISHRLFIADATTKQVVVLLVTLFLCPTYVLMLTVARL